MVEQFPQPDGRVAIFLDGELFCYCRDQAHADDWVPRFEQALDTLAPLAWQIARLLWSGLTPERRLTYSQPQAMERAA